MLDQVTSGLVGLVLGAVLGLGLTVLFEDPLKARLAVLSARVRRLRARRALPSPSAEFRLGPLTTTLLVIEGDGQQVIDEQAVRVLVESEWVTLPPELRALRDDIEKEQLALERAGRQAHWNGANYAVSGFAVQRLGIDEDPGVTLRLKSSDYFTFLATQRFDHRLADGTTVREKYLDPYPPTRAPDFMCSSFGINVVVITADGLLVVVRRSDLVGSFPGRWGVSANEALSRSLDSQGRTPPSLYEVARRGLFEELGLVRTEYRLELLAFQIDRATNQWGCTFVGLLDELTGDELADRLTRGIADKWEYDEHDFVPFTVTDVVRYLLRDDRRDDWTPAAPAACYLALVRHYGRARVERETSRALRARS